MGGYARLTLLSATTRVDSPTRLKTPFKSSPTPSHKVHPSSPFPPSSRPPTQDLQRPKPLTTQMIRSVGLGLFFCFAAFVLLIFANVSGPVWGNISFLNTNIDGREIHFGVYGYTGGPRRLGYTIDQLDTRNGLLNSVIVHKLTYVLVLHPIAAGFAFIAVAFGICGVASNVVGTIIMAMTAALAATITLVVWIIDMVLFGITRNKLRDQGHPAQYGNANWLVLGALIALLLGSCASCFGIFESSRVQRNNQRPTLEKSSV